MNEYEIVDLFLNATTGIWGLLQIWMGVSFGYIALAHFYGKTLNLTLVIVLSALFLTFSISVLGFASINLAAMDGYEMHLREIGKDIELSSGTLNMLEQRNEVHSMFRLPIVLSAVFLLVSGLSYLPYCYWKSRGNDT